PPARIRSLISSTPLLNAASPSVVVHEAGSQPGHGRPVHGVAGRTSANRAQTGEPSEGSTTAQNPSPSSTDRSSVRSTRSLQSIPPTTASARPRTPRWSAAGEGAAGDGPAGEGGGATDTRRAYERDRSAPERHQIGEGGRLPSRRGRPTTTASADVA